MDFALDPQQQQQLSNKSIASIGITVLLHLAIGYALITGLARDVINVITKPIETRIIEDEVPSMDVGLAWSREAELGSATEAFRNFLRFAVTGVGAGRAAAAGEGAGPARKPSVFQMSSSV